MERRLGCQGCPLQGYKKRREFFKDNPRWLKFWVDNAKIHYDKKERAYSVYDFFVARLWYKTMSDYFNDQETSEVGRIDAKAFLEGYFGIKLK